jgi:transposase
LDPSVKESGSFKSSENHISKRGSKLLRKTLYQVSISASIHNPVCKKAYLKKKEEGLSNKSALIVVSRKLLGIIWSVMKNNKPFYIPKYVEAST